MCTALIRASCVRSSAFQRMIFITPVPVYATVTNVKHTSEPHIPYTDQLSALYRRVENRPKRYDFEVYFLPAEANMQSDESHTWTRCIRVFQSTIAVPSADLQLYL